MVYHKDGIVEFARRLLILGWKLLASGGTAKKLTEANLFVTDIATMVGEPILGHRVVSLSREIHAGLLALNSEEHRAELERHGIAWIDLVCIDLYPLEQEINRPGATPDSILELEDIGGPTGLSSGAKGKRIVICDPSDREPVLDMLESRLPFDGEFREHLAAKADFMVSRYRMLTSRYRGKGAFEAIHGRVAMCCLYGENPQQNPATLYTTETNDPLALDRFELLEGQPLSYNNLCDLDRLLQTMTHVSAAMEVNNVRPRLPFIALAVKHGNCCGAAWATEPGLALRRMVCGDRDAIMGGLVMTNFSIGEDDAEILAHYALREGEKRRNLDAIFASEFKDGACEALRRVRDKCRFVQNRELRNLTKASLDTAQRFRYARGGFLVQPNYTFVPNLRDRNVIACEDEPSDEQVQDLAFAWGIGATSNSNTVVIVGDRMLKGLGANQQSRVYAAHLAVGRAHWNKHELEGSVAYSDSFFPFPDGPELLINAGVKAIFTSSGSVNDQATINLCRERKVPLLMVPDRVGRGFFGH